MNVEIIPATLEHVDEIAGCLREADKREAEASTLLSIRRALRCSLLSSKKAWAGFIDGEMVALFGVASASLAGGKGVPWLVGTDLIEKHSITFLRKNRKMLPEIMDGFSVLENWVDARNDLVIRWLKWLGFTMDEPAPHGPHGILFRRFELRR